MKAREIMFMALSIALAWLVVLPLMARPDSPSWAVVLVTMAVLPTPTVAAWMTHRLSQGEGRFVDLIALRGGRALSVFLWSMVGSGVVIGQTVLTVVLDSLFGLASFSFSDAAVHARLLNSHSFLLSYAQPDDLPPAWVIALLSVSMGILVGATLNAAIALVTEAGFRGWWASIRAQEPFWRNAVVMGTFIGVWHIPLTLIGINYPGAGRISACLMFTLYCICAGALMLELRRRSASVIPVAVAHGTISAFSGVFFLFTDPSPKVWLWLSPSGFMGCITMLLLTVAVRNWGEGYRVKKLKALDMDVDRPQTGMRQRN